MECESIEVPARPAWATQGMEVSPDLRYLWWSQQEALSSDGRRFSAHKGAGPLLGCCRCRFEGVGPAVALVQQQQLQLSMEDGHCFPVPLPFACASAASMSHGMLLRSEVSSK